MACECKKPPAACVYRLLVRHEAIIPFFTVGKLSFNAELTKLDLGIFEFIGLLR